jgi:hypothetical protein
MRGAWHDVFGNEAKVNPPMLKSIAAVFHGNIIEKFPGMPCPGASKSIHAQ